MLLPRSSWMLQFHAGVHILTGSSSSLLRTVARRVLAVRIRSLPLLPCFASTRGIIRLRVSLHASLMLNPWILIVVRFSSPAPPWLLRFSFAFAAAFTRFATYASLAAFASLPCVLKYRFTAIVFGALPVLVSTMIRPETTVTLMCTCVSLACSIASALTFVIP